MYLDRILLFALFSTAFSAAGQTNISIVDPSALELVPDLLNDRAAQAGMQAAGINPEMMGTITSLSDPSRWPVGLRTDSARAANQGAFRNFNAFLVCAYSTDFGTRTIISIPMDGNHHMPDDLRAATDLYFVMRPGGTETVELAKAPPSKGPSWSNLPEARITNPEDVFATYDLASDPEALKALEKQGLSKPEVEAVIFRSHERNWPEGIDSFDKRYPKLMSFKKFKARRLAQWGDKELVVVPAETNKKAPGNMRPVLDIYMVFNATAVQVKAKH